MSGGAHRYLVAYDIVDDKRRTRLANLLLSYGYRLQFSLFQVDAKASRMEKLYREVDDIIVKAEDSVLFIDLGPVHMAISSKIRHFGQADDPAPSGPIVF